MKKQINPTIKAHLIRSAFYLLLLVAVCAIPFALAQSRSRGTTNQAVIRPTLLPNLTSLIPTMPTTHAVRAQPGLCPSWDASETVLESSYRRGGRAGERRHRRPRGQESGSAAVSGRWLRHSRALEHRHAWPDRLAIVPVEPPMDNMFTCTAVVILVAVTITTSGGGIR